MNPLREVAALRHRYYAMRHGESEANRLGIVISDPASGIGGYGLTARGRAQAAAGARAAGLPADTRIVCSDFRRARETAEIAAREIGSPHPPATAVALRERFFGRFEGRSNTCYDTVWNADRHDPGHGNDGVEPADAVTARAAGLVLELERHLPAGSTVLLVAHGDVLQLLQAAFRRLPAAGHRSLPHLETAEVRELVLAPPRGA